MRDGEAAASCFPDNLLIPSLESRESDDERLQQTLHIPTRCDRYRVLDWMDRRFLIIPSYNLSVGAGADREQTAV
eukprot:scaffold35477_cov143-Skeletonema_marinoi.AAC.4